MKIICLDIINLNYFQLLKLICFFFAASKLLINIIPLHIIHERNNFSTWFIMYVCMYRKIWCHYVIINIPIIHHKSISNVMLDRIG